ncbi:MAG: OmpH family outer membrane protein [Syntrophobacteraceae bacterium]
MKKFLSAIAIATGIIFGLSASSLAASGSPKIGFIDMEGAAGQSQWGKRIGEDLRRELERMNSEIELKAKAAKTAFDDYDKKKDVMDEKARNKKQRELQEMATELERLKAESRAKYNKQLNDAVSPISQKVREIVAKIGKDDKYDYILERAAVPYANDRDDLTRRVSAELDKVAPR